MDGRRQPRRPVPARRSRRRLDSIHDPGARASGLRVAGLLAVTPRGLRTLLERGGVEVESVGSWGNRQCVVGDLSRWSAYRPWHSLHDEPDLPVQVRAFARRP